MKSYSKPTISVENIELDDVILSSGPDTGTDEVFDPFDGSIDGEIIIPL